jgi:hypothetical protein
MARMTTFEYDSRELAPTCLKVAEHFLALRMIVVESAGVTKRFPFSCSGVKRSNCILHPTCCRRQLELFLQT